MKKMLVAVIASVFATVAFAQDVKKDEKKTEAKPAATARRLPRHLPPRTRRPLRPRKGHLRKDTKATATTTKEAKPRKKTDVPRMKEAGHRGTDSYRGTCCQGREADGHEVGSQEVIIDIRACLNRSRPCACSFFARVFQ